jgi:hypothetical protein
MMANKSKKKPHAFGIFYWNKNVVESKNLDGPNCCWRDTKNNILLLTSTLRTNSLKEKSCRPVTGFFFFSKLRLPMTKQ